MKQTRLLILAALDIIATRQLASALYAYLHSDAEFQTLMQEARKEYQSMTPSAIQTVMSCSATLYGQNMTTSTSVRAAPTPPGILP